MSFLHIDMNDAGSWNPSSNKTRAFVCEMLFISSWPQCVNEVPWHSIVSISTVSTQATILYIEFENYTLEIIAQLPLANEFRGICSRYFFFQMPTSVWIILSMGSAN